MASMMRIAGRRSLMNITLAACVLPAEYACGECMCAGDCIAGRILKTSITALRIKWYNKSER